MQMVRTKVEPIRKGVFAVVVFIDALLIGWGIYLILTGFNQGSPLVQSIPITFMFVFLGLGLASGVWGSKIARVGMIILRLALVYFLAGVWKEPIANFMPTTIALLPLAILSPGSWAQGRE